MRLKLFLAALPFIAVTCFGAPAHVGPSSTQVTTGTIAIPDGSVIGYTLHRSHIAASTPLVIVNGLGGVQSDFNDVVHHFTDTRSVLTFDHRGIGASSVVNYTSITREAMASDLDQLLKHLGWTKINLLGVSMGTVISEEFLKSHASNYTVEHLILMGTTYKSGLDGPLTADVGEWLQEIPLPPNEEDWKGVIRKIFAESLTPGYRERNKKGLAHFLAEIDSGVNRNFQAFMAQSKALDSYDNTESVKTISSPTLILHGAQDVVLVVDAARQLHALIPRSTYIEYATGGHILFTTNPEVFHVIRKYIAKN